MCLRQQDVRQKPVGIWGRGFPSCPVRTPSLPAYACSGLTPSGALDIILDALLLGV